MIGSQRFNYHWRARCGRDHEKGLAIVPHRQWSYVTLEKIGDRVAVTVARRDEDRRRAVRSVDRAISLRAGTRSDFLRLLDARRGRLSALDLLLGNLPGNGDIRTNPGCKTQKTATVSIE
jgi:hypothetical protein